MNDSPHASYIEAVANAFTRANMEPTFWEPLDSDAPEGVIHFGSDHPAIDTYSSWPGGVELVWDVGGWQVVDVDDRSGMEIRSDSYIDPDALVTLVRPLLVDGDPMPREWDTSRWEHADTVEKAVNASLHDGA
ncbi:hypothetical protein ACH4LN_18115 [Streptomyces albus]|uniref:hypothetical protein n=1 Tax=Streptomyces albus TaxID=1888 RepID=UPI0037A03F06